MANEEKIDEIIDPAAFAQIDKLLSQLGVCRAEFVGFAKDIAEVNKIMAKSQSFKDFETNAAKILILEEKLAQAKIKTAQLQEKASQATAKGAADAEKKIQREMAAQTKLANQSDKITAKRLQDEAKTQAAYKKTAEQLQRNSRPYTVLSNTLETQRKRAQDLAVIYGENSEQFQNAAKGVIELDARLKAIDATLGKNQRNVGNYASGFDRFGNSINQLTRELPALAVNAQTFFLAISNNLPALFDAISEANRIQKEAKEVAIADAKAKGEATKATELAAGASEEAASAAGDLAKEQALAAAEAIKTPGAFKQFIGSLFSLQTALSIGVTLLTLYGAEIVKYIRGLMKGSGAADAAAKSFENLSKSFEDPSLMNAVKNISELEINLKLAKQGILDKEKVLNQYNETIGKTTGEVKTLDEAEKALGKNAKAYVEMTLYKAAAQLTLDEAAKASVEAAREAMENEKKLQRQQGAAVIAGDKEGEAARKILVKERKRVNQEGIKDAEESNKELLSIADEFQKKAAEIAKNNKFDFFGGEQDNGKKTNTDAIDLLIQRVQFEVDSQKAIADNERNTLDERLTAVKNFTDASKRLADLTAKRDLSEADISKSRIVAIKENQANEVTKIDQQSADLTFKINDAAQKELVKLMKEGLKAYEDGEKKKIEALQVSIAEQQELLSQYADSAMLGLAEQYSKGIISEKQYAQARLDVQRQYVLDSINEDIKGVDAVIDKKKKAGLETASDEKALADLRKKLSKETAEQEIDDLVKVAEKEKELRDKRIELAFAVGELGISIVNGVFENQKNKIQEQMDLDDVKAQRDIENVNNSVLSEQEKADKIAIIEARANAQRQMLEQQQRQIEIRQAKFQKAASIARIIANTAVAITAALPNIPLSILIGAIGAVQVAQVIATPIPQYFTGTDSSKPGYALTDELGPEGYIEPGGKSYIGSNKPNIKNLKAGTKIIPHHELVQMMAKPEINAYVGGKEFDLTPLIAAQQESTRELKKAFANQKSHSTIITKHGWRNTQAKMKDLDEYVRRNFN